MNPIAISFQGVTKTFAGNTKPALDNLSLDIRRNEFFTLLGPSGCGKTTLLRMIAGFDVPDMGDVKLDGASLLSIPPHRRPVNTVFQSYALFPHMNVAQNIAFGLEMLGWKTADIQVRVSQILALLRLDGLDERRPNQLSGGQQQRVALGRALAPQPKVLLLDEPLSALDLKLRKEMQIELKRLQMDTGITFIFVTHDQEEALTMSDRVAVLRDGRIIQIGAPEEIYESPADQFVAGFIGEANFWNATCVSRGMSGGSFQLNDGCALIEVADSAGFDAGQSVMLVARPEYIKIDENGGIQARLVHIAYRGSDVLLDLRLQNGTPLRACVQSHASRRYIKGQDLRLHVPPSAIRVFEP